MSPQILIQIEKNQQSACCGGFVRSLAFHTLDYCPEIVTSKRHSRLNPDDTFKTPLFPCCVYLCCRVIRSLARALRLPFSHFNNDEIQYGSKWIKCKWKRNLYQNKYAFFELFIFMCMNLDCVRRSSANIALSLSRFSIYSIKPIKAYNGSFVNDIDVRAVVFFEVKKRWEKKY